MSASLANKSAELIIERLKNPQAEVSQLVEEILKLGEKEGIRAFNINMSDLIDWITEVIAENKLGALILFWDEISKFFFNNRNNFDEFQRLAELTNIAPFYLVIATHETGSLVAEGDKGFKILRDRFIHSNITLPNNIAFELIGHALKVKSAARGEWERISATLKKRTEKPRKAVMEFTHINNENILTAILPIHPVAAIMLKSLASYFSSNQRSIFNFIKNNDPSIKAFQDFITHNSPLDGKVLTVDYLWDFFYDSGTDEHGGSVGRMNLKPQVRAILDSYVTCKDSLSPEEQAVLKTVLLFQAIDTGTHEGIELFKPTKENLELAFKGDGRFENRAVQIANELVKKEILFNRPGKIVTFATMSISGDLAEIENHKQKVADNVKTAELVRDGNLLSVIEMDTVHSARYVLTAVTADNFTLTINRLTNEKEDYHIKAVVCFARNEAEHSKLYNLIGEAVGNSRYHKLVFIDASSNLMNSELFKSWVDSAANEIYWRGKDNPLAEKMKTSAADRLNDWKATFENGSYVYYPAVKNEDEPRKGISCQSAKKVKAEMTDNVRHFYPYSFDAADITGTLFQSLKLKVMAEAGIEQTTVSMMTEKNAKIIFGDIWKMSGKYWKIYPDINISRLKIELDTLIKNELAKNIRIAFDDIVAFLFERGFMPLNVYAYVTGFLLKEYAGDPYRFSVGTDGNLGGAMTVQKLAECINDSFKNNSDTPIRNYRPKYIEIMSQNQRRFMEFAAEIFNVREDISVEQSAQTLRLKMITLNYPLWCYADVADEKYADFLKLLMEIANSKQAVAISPLAEGAGKFLMSTPEAFHDLKIFLTEKTGEKIFADFLKSFEGGIFFELAQKIGIENVVAECQRSVTAGDSIWLHDKETSIEVLKNLIVDYKIIIESSKFGIDGKSFTACLAAWKNHCQFNMKIPNVIISDYYPQLRDFFSMLNDICLKNDLPQSSREKFLRYLTEDAAIIADAFSAQIRMLRDKFAYNLTGLSEEEINNVYDKLPISSFTDNHGSFFKKLDGLIKNEKGGRLKNELVNLWREVAGNKLPREWSKSNRTPILAMVPKAEKSAAKKVFETIMAMSPAETDVQFAIEYLKKRPKYFSALNDTQKIEDAFTKAITAKYRGLLDNNNEVRNELESKLNVDAYEWYSNTRVNEVVEEFARNKYYSGGAYDKVSAKVQRMSDKEAKELLMKLLDKNYEVGINLLRED
ncbi:MAG: hypothetical protein IJU91_04005 [Selenomonadaceae bacterium]|nr:hypothetical protein [Selenomonadaceae bacterium]